MKRINFRFKSVQPFQYGSNIFLFFLFFHLLCKLEDFKISKVSERNLVWTIILTDSIDFLNLLMKQINIMANLRFDRSYCPFDSIFKTLTQFITNLQSSKSTKKAINNTRLPPWRAAPSFDLYRKSTVLSPLLFRSHIAPFIISVPV